MKCSNCSNDMVRSKAGWLCAECGHVEIMSDEHKAEHAAANPLPEILGSPAPVQSEPEAEAESKADTAVEGPPPEDKPEPVEPPLTPPPAAAPLEVPKTIENHLKPKAGDKSDSKSALKASEAESKKAKKPAKGSKRTKVVDIVKPDEKPVVKTATTGTESKPAAPEIIAPSATAMATQNSDPAAVPNPVIEPATPVMAALASDVAPGITTDEIAAESAPELVPAITTETASEIVPETPSETAADFTLAPEIVPTPEAPSAPGALETPEPTEAPEVPEVPLAPEANIPGSEPEAGPESDPQSEPAVPEAPADQLPTANAEAEVASAPESANPPAPTGQEASVAAGLSGDVPEAVIEALAATEATAATAPVDPAPPVVTDIHEGESPEKVLQDSIAEIGSTVPTAEPPSSPGAASEAAAASEPPAAENVPNPNSADPAVVSSGGRPMLSANPADEPDPSALRPASSTPIVPAPETGRPPLLPVTNPQPLTRKRLALISATVALLASIGGGALYASIKSAPAPAVKSAPTPTPTPKSVLSAETTPEPTPVPTPDPAISDAQRKTNLAILASAYLATAQQGYYAVSPPAVATTVTDPTTGQPYVISQAVPTALGQIQYWPGGSCTGKPVKPGAVRTKYLALKIMLETSPTPYCLDVK